MGGFRVWRGGGARVVKGGRVGRAHLLLAVATCPLTTHPFQDGARFEGGKEEGRRRRVWALFFVSSIFVVVTWRC